MSFTSPGCPISPDPAIIPGCPKQPHGSIGHAHFIKPRPSFSRHAHTRLPGPRPTPKPRPSAQVSRHLRGRAVRDVWRLCGHRVPGAGHHLPGGRIFPPELRGVRAVRPPGLRADLCKNCHHLIARHEYTFSVVDDYQEYTMLCLLCGRAEDSVSILPDDPRQMTPLF